MILLSYNPCVDKWDVDVKLFTGLVFSDLGDNSTCGSLSPFYTLWDTESTGNLIGFGLLSFGYDPLPNSKIVDEYTLKVVYELKLFKQLGAIYCKPRVAIPTPLGLRPRLPPPPSPWLKLTFLLHMLL